MLTSYARGVGYVRVLFVCFSAGGVKQRLINRVDAKHIFVKKREFIIGRINTIFLPLKLIDNIDLGRG